MLNKTNKNDRSQNASERNKAINPFPNYVQFGKRGEFVDDEGRMYKFARYGDGFHQIISGSETMGKKKDDIVRDDMNLVKIYVKIPSQTHWFKSNMETKVVLRKISRRKHHTGWKISKTRHDILIRKMNTGSRFSKKTGFIMAHISDEIIQ